MDPVGFFKFLIPLTTFFLLQTVCVIGEICQSPSVKSNTYTTTDGMVATYIAFVADFSVTCDRSLKDLSLYADIIGKTVPTIKSMDNKYQASWVDEYANLPSGEYGIRVFDEDGFAALRKAQRSGEDESKIQNLIMDIYHAGVYYGPIVQSEFLAALVSVIVWYIAFSARSKLVT